MFKSQWISIADVIRDAHQPEKSTMSLSRHKFRLVPNLLLINSTGAVKNCAGDEAVVLAICCKKNGQNFMARDPRKILKSLAEIREYKDWESPVQNWGTLITYERA